MLDLDLAHGTDLDGAGSDRCAGKHQNERGMLVDILGVCSVLETTAHRGYAERFVRYADRELPGKRFVEHVYPACWWTAADGVNREQLKR